MRIYIPKIFESDFHFRELLKGSTTFLVLKILGWLSTYMFTLFATRRFGAYGWGVFTICFTLLQMISVIGKFGMDITLLRFVAQYNTQKQKDIVKYIYFQSMKLAITISILLSLLLVLFSSFIAQRIFSKEYLAFYIKLTSLCILPFVVLSLNAESLRGLKKIFEYVLSQNVLPFLSGVLFFFLFVNLFHMEDVAIIILSYIFGLILATIVSSFCFFNYFKGIKTTCAENTKKKFIKEVLNVSFSIFISTLVSVIISLVDTILLGIWRSEEDVGIYNVAFRLSLLISFPLSAINSIAAPKFAEFWSNRDFRGLKIVSQQSTKLVFLFSLPIFIVLLVFSKKILYIFGNEFVKGLWALVILSFGQLINASVGSVGYILQMTGKEKMVRNILVGSLFLNLIFNYLLIPRYGVLGASFANASCVIFINILSCLMVFKEYKFVTFRS